MVLRRIKKKNEIKFGTFEDKSLQQAAGWPLAINVSCFFVFFFTWQNIKQTVIAPGPFVNHTNPYLRR